MKNFPLVILHPVNLGGLVSVLPALQRSDPLFPTPFVWVLEGGVVGVDLSHLLEEEGQNMLVAGMIHMEMHNVEDVRLSII